MVGMVLVAIPEIALACPVCGGGGRNADAYVDMTIFLSLLPLGLIASVVGFYFVVWRRMEHEPSAVEASGAGRPPHDG